MMRLTKYLKPYVLLIVIAIALLFVQANADLALPDYLAKIINNGIQLSGIENAVPQAIRLSSMDKLTLFMSEQDKTPVLADYTVVQKLQRIMTSWSRITQSLPQNQSMCSTRSIKLKSINLIH